MSRKKTLLLGSQILRKSSEGRRRYTFVTTGSSSVTATRLLVYTQPQGAITGSVFTTQPVVRAVDANGNLDTSFTGDVTLAKKYGTGTLSGTATVAASGGVATFTNLVFTGTGRHVLEATGGGLTAGRSGGMVVNPTATAAPTVLRYGANTNDRTACGSGATIDDLPNAGAMTVIVRMRRNTGGPNQFFMSKYGGGDTGWYMQCDDGTAAGEVVFSVGRAGGVAFSLSSTTITNGLWYDVIGTWSTADATRSARILLAQVGSTLAEVSYEAGFDGVGAGAVNTDANADLWIGGLQATGVNPILGDIEYASVFNKVLTAAELATVRQGFDRKNTAHIVSVGGCAVLHRLNSTGALTDLSGNANNGTTTGATTTTGLTNQFAPAVFGCSNNVVDNTTYLYTNGHAEISYITTATSVTIGAVRTLDAAYSPQAAIAVHENGVYKGQILIAAVGSAYGTLALTAGSKTVTFSNGVRSNPSGGGANEGTFLTSVLFNASATEVVPTTYAANRTIVGFGDSLWTGFLADPVGSSGLIAQLRTYYRALGYEVIDEGGGGWQVYDFALDASARTASAQLIGLYSTELFLTELGTNDIGRGDWTQTNFGIGYAAWLVAINGENPRTSIKAITMPRNGGGETGYAAWRAEIDAAAVGKAYVVVTAGNPGFWDGSNPSPVDNVHEGNTAYVDFVFPAVKTIIGF